MKPSPDQQDFSLYSLFVPLTTKKIVIFIILIGIFVFFNMLANGFVWDDKTFIQYNPDVRHLDILYLLKANMFNNVNAGQYRFFPALYFTILFNFFGLNTFFYHIAQLAIHITNSILVFYVLRHFFKEKLSFFLSIVFLVHPIQVESVSYIASSGNTLFFFFGILALLLNMSEKISIKRTILIFLLLLFSLFSKETGVIFIFLIVLYRFIFYNKNWVQILYGTITVGIYAFIRFAVAGVFFHTVRIAPIANLPLSQRLVSTPAVVLYYLYTFAFPSHLAIEQSWLIEKFSLTGFYIPLLIDILFFFSTIWLGLFIYKKDKKQFRKFLFFFIFFFAALFTYTQLFALDMTVADRWFYFPFFGLLGLLGILTQVVLKKYKFASQTLLIISAVIICLLSIRTIVRNTNWYSPITIYSHDGQIEDNFDLENSLGAELNMAGRHTEAMPHFKKSVELFPHETNLFNLALGYEQDGNTTLARKYYLMAYNAKGYGQVPFPHHHHDVTYQRLAIVLLPVIPNKALEVISAGVTDYPDNAILWYLKALVDYKLGRHDDAVVDAGKASSLLPNDQNAKNVYEKLLQNKSIDTTIK